MLFFLEIANRKPQIRGRSHEWRLYSLKMRSRSTQGTARQLFCFFCFVLFLSEYTHKHPHTRISLEISYKQPELFGPCHSSASSHACGLVLLDPPSLTSHAVWKPQQLYVCWPQGDELRSVNQTVIWWLWQLIRVLKAMNTTFHFLDQDHSVVFQKSHISVET